jgi:FMN phosphatase YigB (HAD superfamily)
MPSSRCYRQVLQRLGFEASQTLFVAGLARRLGGAGRCGLRTAGFNEDRVTPGAVSLERFSDLLRLVPTQRLARRAG